MVEFPENYLSPTLSPDETRLAFTSAGDVWVYELGRGGMTLVTVGGGHGNPVWTADGRYVVFRAAQGMFWARADGTGEEQQLIQGNHSQTPWSFTTNGRLAFVERNPAFQIHGYPSRAEIWTVSVKSDGLGLHAGTPEVFLQESLNARSPMFSPDGRWIAYQLDELGDVYVQAFPDKHGKQKISPNGGVNPSFGRERGTSCSFCKSDHPCSLWLCPISCAEIRS